MSAKDVDWGLIRQPVIRVLLPYITTTTGLPCHTGILNQAIMTVLSLATEKGSTTLTRMSLMASLCTDQGLAQRPLSKGRVRTWGEACMCPHQLYHQSSPFRTVLEKELLYALTPELLEGPGVGTPAEAPLLVLGLLLLRKFSNSFLAFSIFSGKQRCDVTLGFL